MLRYVNPFTPRPQGATGVATVNPTPEQQAFLDVIGDGNGIVCQAGAGAGKTTVMRAGAHRLTERGQRGIYTAFNKAIVDSAKGKFPRGVAPMTTYGIAWHAHGKAWSDRINIKGQTLRDVARIVGVREPLNLGKDIAPLSVAKVARLVLAT